MTVLKVEDMHCENCVRRITQALRDAKLEFEVSLENKTVSVGGCEHCVKRAIDELADLGFDAVQQ